MSYLLERESLERVEEYRRQANLYGLGRHHSFRARLAAGLRALADRLEPRLERKPQGAARLHSLHSGRE